MTLHIQNLYFQEIILHFETHSPLALALDHDLAPSAAWHVQRSLEILTRILRDVSFARRVQTLKISEQISAGSNLDFETGELRFCLTTPHDPSILMF